MRLVVFGANGPTGRLATEMAMSRGHDVTAVTRRPESFPLRGESLRVVGADVLDAAAVDAAVAGQQAVISALGVPYTKETVRTYSQGAANMIAAMRAHGLRRLVCVTSTGTSGEHAEGETFTFKKIIAPILLRMGRTVYDDMARMEKVVAESGLDWTVIRPAGLFDGDGVTDYRAEPRRLPGRFTSRTDLADLLVREATEDIHVGQFIDVVTTTGAPTFAQMFIREALHIGK
ncbi:MULTISPECIES: NAD(P)-dependent oxidoreductase [unclassified Micromonospora]|uniref:NAD(P)-dependent oxidoreductase n=1 Tax=unclassified Micromonospora TaxID=2617518 RepID=UPI001B37DF15|nr:MULTISPECIES: NAD(P)H-binding protein [unclassified Micromonospora]MBQ1041636.1 NAD(P)H-binding protein [Micromonospora sp. C72]MBQ1053319.1 NAD(P)H-binding protein [Micromonospora sp. C32]